MTILNTLFEFLAENVCGLFNMKGFEFRIFNTNSLFRGVMTNFWAKVDIEVKSFFKSLDEQYSTFHPQPASYALATNFRVDDYDLA